MQNQEAAQNAERIARDVARMVEQTTAQAVRGGGRAGFQGIDQLRQELKDQLASLEEQRVQASGQLSDPAVSAPNRAALTKRIDVLDARIALVDQQLAEVNSAITRSSAFQGVRIAPPRAASEIPKEALAIPVLFIVCVLLPITIAYARRIWNRGAPAANTIPTDLNDRLARLDQNLDAVALEVERIGEGQRFLTRAFAEQQQRLSPGAAERVEVSERDKEWQRRGS